MSGFRDIHAHFVYGLDDGAKTKKDMEAMIDAAYADGVASLFATPHVTPGICPFDDALFERHLEEAREYCRQKDYPMSLYKGAEIMYTPALQPYVTDRRIPTLAGSRGVLLEFTPKISFREMESAVELLEHCGYITILAHVERYQCLSQGQNAYRLKRTHDVRFQMNGSTVIEEKSLFRHRRVWRWLRDELIDYVATDSHSCHRRPTNMTEAHRLLSSRLGQAYADALTGLDTSD